MAALNNPNCAELMAQALELQVKSLNDQIALLRGYVPAAAVPEDESSDKAGGKKKKKKVVDPNRPKRSHSAYQMFIMEVLPKLKEEHPELPQKDIMSLGAKQWATCPPHKKEALEAIANKEKAAYDAVLAAYDASLAASNTSTASSSAGITQSTAAPVVKAKRPRAKSEKKESVTVPIAPPTPVVSEPLPGSVPVVQTVEKKRKKEKKSKKEAATPGEESTKKKKSEYRS